MSDKENNQQNVQRFQWLAVDKRMLFCKMGHFTFYSALGCCIPYMTIFFVSVGLSRKEAGFISGICFIFSALSSSLWGFLADYTKKRKLILIILCLLSTLIIVAKPLVVWKVNKDYNSFCFTNSSMINSTASVEGCERKPFQSTLFAVVLVMYILLQCFCIPISSQLDALIMNIIKCNPGTSFGNQRVFGAIGFGISSFLSGIAADNFSVPSFSNYTPVFIISSPIFLILIPIICVLSKQTNWEVESEAENLADVSMQNAEESKLRLVLSKLKHFNTIFFFISVLIVGAVTSLFYSFNFLLMGDEMNATRTSMGLVTFVACFSETIMFPFTKRIIEYLGNPLICVELGAFSFVLRLAILSYIENAWLCAPVQVLHSLGFALFWAASIEYVGSKSTNAISSTMFGILSSVYFGLGSLIGNMAGGVFYDMFGGRRLFRGVAVFNLGWVIMMIVYLHLFNRRRQELKVPKETLKSSECLKDSEEIASLNENERFMKANC